MSMRKNILIRFSCFPIMALHTFLFDFAMPLHFEDRISDFFHFAIIFISLRKGQ